jgi:hypothetical protein
MRDLPSAAGSWETIMGKAQPVNPSKPPQPGGTEPADEGDVQGVVPPAEVRPDPFIRGLSDDPDA